MNAENYNLKPVWNAILEIYVAIADICERHNLTFYVTGGNCLGAVRHKGFIPWDDDLDVFLPWDDYDLFWKYAKEELPHYWKDVGWWNTPEYPEVFGKIQETRVDVLDQVSRESGLELPHGIYVDVFPLVGCPKTFFEKCFWKFSGWCLKLKMSSISILIAEPRKTFRSKIVWVFRKLFRHLYPKVVDLQTAIMANEKRARRYPCVSDGYCGWYVVGIQDVITPIPVRFFGKAEYLPFESIKVPVPGDYLGYLKYKFGDYMKLPPEEMRHPTHGDIPHAPWRLGPTGIDIRAEEI